MHDLRQTIPNSNELKHKDTTILINFIAFLSGTEQFVSHHRLLPSPRENQAVWNAGVSWTIFCLNPDVFSFFKPLLNSPWFHSPSICQVNKYILVNCWGTVFVSTCYGLDHEGNN